MEILEGWFSLEDVNTHFSSWAIPAWRSGPLDSCHGRLAVLWHVEAQAKHFDDAMLYAVRWQAAQVVSCLRMARAVYHCIRNSCRAQMKSLSDLIRSQSLPNPIYEPCPWLTRRNQDTGMPFYLWDVKNKKTVVVEKIKSSGGYLEYVAIGHTWGRWEIKGVHWIRVPGVPWRIPPNTKFNVRDLPRLLQPLPWDYVRMD